MNQKHTLKTIGDRFGVTPATVSRALNDKPDIGFETKRKIQEYAKEIGFSLNLNARSLRTNQTGAIGVVITDLENTFYTSVVNNIERVANEAGYVLMLLATKNDKEKEAEAIRTLVQKRVDGMLISPVSGSSISLDPLERSGIPYVGITKPFSDPRANFVAVDDFQCGFLATEHLLKKGHERICFISGSLSSSSCRKRKEGYLAALKQWENPYHAVIETKDYRIQSAYECMQKLLVKEPPFSGVVTYNDNFAIGAIHAITQKQIAIPDRIAVIGMDGIEFGEFILPRLTTLKIPSEEIGCKACSILLDNIKERKNGGESHKEKQRIMMLPSLLLRESV